MVDALKAGMKLHAVYSADGEYYPAVIVTISESKKRVNAPVKVAFVGYDDAEWKAVSELKSKKYPKPEAKGKAKAKAKGKAKAKIQQEKGKTEDNFGDTKCPLLAAHAASMNEHVQKLDLEIVQFGARQFKRLTKRLADFEKQLAAKDAEVEKLKEKVQAHAPEPYLVELQTGLGGRVSLCEVPVFPITVKNILDLHAKKKGLSSKKRGLLKVVKGEEVLPEWQSLKMADMPDVRILQAGAVEKCLAIEVVNAGPAKSIKDFLILNSRTGVVSQVDQNICPEADTLVAHGSKVCVVLRDNCQKLFEITEANQVDALKRILEWKPAHRGWRTKESIDLGNAENQGWSNIILPAGSILCGHRPKPVRCGVDHMFEPFHPDQVHAGSMFLFQCSPFEVAMSDLDVEQNQWNPTCIEVEGFPINPALVPNERQLGSAVTSGSIIQPGTNPLDVRKNTGLNVLAIQPANGRLELAPSSETPISRGCRLFFMKGHKEKVESGGQITLEGVPFFA